jgi:tetratricopeptide (TPR) repeat protein
MVMKLAPADSRGILCRGFAHAKGRNWAPAIQDLTKAIEGKQAPVAAYYWRGKSYFETDAYEAASGDADKALALNPRFAAAVALKGNVLLAKGEVDQALGEFERALGIQGNNLDAIIGRSAALIAKTLPKASKGDKE